jgi:hypothetical protein
MIRPIAISSWSINGCLLMATTYSGAQTFDCPKLKLLDCALRFLKFVRDVANTFLFDEAHVNHAKLRFRQPVHQLEKYGAALHFFRFRPVGFR